LTAVAPWNGVQGIPPAIVIVDRVRKRAVIVAIAVRGHATRQAQTDVTVGLRIAEAKPRDRKHQIGQSEDRRDRVDLVANDADGTNTESGRFRAQDRGLHRQRGIDACVEEPFQRAVADRLSAQFTDTLQASRISRKTKNTGESPIHGMPGNSLPIAARWGGSPTRKIDACWKSDLAEVLKAAATSRSSRPSPGITSL